MKAFAIRCAALTAILTFSLPALADEQLSGAMPSIESLDSALKNLSGGLAPAQTSISPAEAAASMAAPEAPPLAPPISTYAQAGQSQPASIPSAPMAAKSGQSLIDPKTQKFSAPVVYVYEFSAKWCPSCKQLAPVVEKAAQKYAGFVQYIPINVDKNQELVKKLNIAQIPTVMVIDRQGRMLNRLIGLQQGSQIDTILDHYKQQTLASLEGQTTH